LGSLQRAQLRAAAGDRLFENSVMHGGLGPDEMQKQEIRRLATPVYRYADVGAGLRNGVIFGLTTNGTNPDLLLLIELRGERLPGQRESAPR
jgi:hypothetical protein